MQRVTIKSVRYGEAEKEGFEPISLTVEINGEDIHLPDCALNHEILLPLAVVCNVELPTVDENGYMPEYVGCDCILEIEDNKVLNVYDLECNLPLKRRKLEY
jgi:hypothetical protein